jgi:hypothetical protein
VVGRVVFRHYPRYFIVVARADGGFLIGHHLCIGHGAIIEGDIDLKMCCERKGSRMIKVVDGSKPLYDTHTLVNPYGEPPALRGSRELSVLCAQQLP